MQSLSIAYKCQLVAGIVGQAYDAAVFEKLYQLLFNILVLPVHGTGLLIGAAVQSQYAFGNYFFFACGLQNPYYR